MAAPTSTPQPSNCISMNLPIPRHRHRAAAAAAAAIETNYTLDGEIRRMGRRESVCVGYAAAAGGGYTKSAAVVVATGARVSKRFEDRV